MRDTPNAENHNFNEVKKIELMGVQEMDAKEMRNVDGGIVGAIAAAIIIAGVVYAAKEFVKDVIINKTDYDPTN
ncbi:MAG: class IIb bacteriocin, lactobin A/cerein 7B family [Bacteroidales bacterium]|nr:class IIb bacteriocin, lactobin A/cerein 7B family [Bacteroidales bacterium]